MNQKDSRIFWVSGDLDATHPDFIFILTNKKKIFYKEKLHALIYVNVKCYNKNVLI